MSHFYKISIRTVDEMRGVLLDPTVEGPDEAYFVISSLSGNITILPPLMLGSEFNKTYGHYHNPPFEEKYRLLYGQGVVLMQKLKDPRDFYSNVVEVILAKLEKDKDFLIPKGYGHILINIGKSELIVSDNWNNKNAEHIYAPIAANRGMGYYIVRSEGGGVGFEENPNYGKLPPLEISDI